MGNWNVQLIYVNFTIIKIFSWICKAGICAQNSINSAYARFENQFCVCIMKTSVMTVNGAHIMPLNFFLLPGERKREREEIGGPNTLGTLRFLLGVMQRNKRPLHAICTQPRYTHTHTYSPHFFFALESRRGAEKIDCNRVEGGLLLLSLSSRWLFIREIEEAVRKTNFFHRHTLAARPGTFIKKKKKKTSVHDQRRAFIILPPLAPFSRAQVYRGGGGEQVT